MLQHGIRHTLQNGKAPGTTFMTWWLGHPFWRATRIIQGVFVPAVAPAGDRWIDREGRMPMARALALPVFATMPTVAAELPQDVSAFVARRERCDPFRGEEAEDPVRRRAIGRGLEANCRGTDAASWRPEQRYAGDRGVRTRLEGYDPRIE